MLLLRPSSDMKPDPGEELFKAVDVAVAAAINKVDAAKVAAATAVAAADDAVDGIVTAASTTSA